MIRLALIICLLLTLCGCSHKEARPSSSELFKLRLSCAEQARQFEADWSRSNPQGLDTVKFRNHYNDAVGRCFVEARYTEKSSAPMALVYDALEGYGKPPVAAVAEYNNKGQNTTNHDAESGGRLRNF